MKYLYLGGNIYTPVEIFIPRWKCGNILTKVRIEKNNYVICGTLYFHVSLANTLYIISILGYHVYCRKINRFKTYWTSILSISQCYIIISFTCITWLYLSEWYIRLQWRLNYVILFIFYEIYLLNNEIYGPILNWLHNQ